MREKQTGNSEIHWLLASQRINPGEQANSKIHGMLPADIATHFAKMYVGNKRWIWKLDVDATPVSALPPTEATEAHAALDRLQTATRAALHDDALAERLLTYPNDDYLMSHRTPDGRIDVILTGWGFTNKKSASGGAIHNKQAVKPPVWEQPQVTETETETEEVVAETPPTPPLQPEQPPVPPVVETDPETPPPPPQPRQARIRVADSKGQCLIQTPVTLMQEGVAPMEVQIDANGDCLFDKTHFRMGMPIQALVRDETRAFPAIPFTMSDDEDDYLLQETTPPTPWWVILLEVMLALAAIIAICFIASPFVDGAEALTTLFH